MTTDIIYISINQVKESDHIESSHLPESDHIEYRHLPESDHIESDNLPESDHIESDNLPENVDYNHLPESDYIKSNHLPESDHIESNHLPESENIELLNNLSENVILNINNGNIIYPNEKIYQVAPIIEEKIIERDNYQPSDCLVRCQNCIRMFLDIATQIYIFFEELIKFLSMIIVIIDIFNITNKKIKIIGRSKYNYFIIESSENERLRRIVYWFYYNYITPDECEWRETINKFNLDKVPNFTIRLYKDNIKSTLSIELSNLILQSTIDGNVVKGSREIKLYEDISNETIDNIIICSGKRLLKCVDGKIPIGGLMPEKFISDLGVNKLDKIN